MKQVSQKQLTQNIKLVKWQQSKKVKKYNMLTIHSLLLNANPKFIQLKKLIEDYNRKVDQNVDRKHLKEQYIGKIYTMLSQMILIPVWENQLEFLNKVYNWATKGGGELSDFNTGGGKSRPTTASTRTRPFSAYSRPKSGVPGIRTLNSVQKQRIQKIQATKTQNETIDYSKLKPGDIQFYNGMRTLHVGEQQPRKLLKQYRRKVFYDQDGDSDLEVLDLEKPKQKKLPQIQPTLQPDQIQTPEGQLEKPQQAVQGQQVVGQQELGGEAEDDINVDDIPIEGEGVEQEQEQVIDKLKPRLQSYINHETDLSRNLIGFNRGIKQVFNEKNSFARKKQQDAIMHQKMAEWAREKSRVKRQQKRRAQSARMVTQKLGIAYNNAKKETQNVNMINFENVLPHQTKITRPKTAAFQSTNLNNRKQLIEKCFMNSNMGSHINKFETVSTLQNQRYMRVTSLAERPKKKTFQQILRQAESKVKQQEMDEIMNVKAKFAKHKVPFQTNRIAKSITCHTGGGQEEEQEQFAGLITGMNMLNNPFFKSGKKKKKKKKKK